MFNSVRIFWLYSNYILWGNDLYNEPFTQASTHSKSLFKEINITWLLQLSTCLRVVQDGNIFRSFPLSSLNTRGGGWADLYHVPSVSWPTTLAQLKVKTLHRSGCLISLQMRTERIAHLVSPWDDDGVRQHVCGSLSQTQTHSELAAVMEMRWALFSNVRAMEPKQWCHRWLHAKQEQRLFRISNSSRWLLVQQAYRSKQVLKGWSQISENVSSESRGSVLCGKKWLIKEATVDFNSRCKSDMTNSFVCHQFVLFFQRCRISE